MNFKRFWRFDGFVANSAKFSLDGRRPTIQWKNFAIGIFLGMSRSDQNFSRLQPPSLPRSNDAWHGFEKCTLPKYQLKYEIPKFTICVPKIIIYLNLKVLNIRFKYGLIFEFNKFVLNQVVISKSINWNSDQISN